MKIKLTIALVLMLSVGSLSLQANKPRNFLDKIVSGLGLYVLGGYATYIQGSSLKDEYYKTLALRKSYQDAKDIKIKERQDCLNWFEKYYSLGRTDSNYEIASVIKLADLELVEKSLTHKKCFKKTPEKRYPFKPLEILRQNIFPSKKKAQII